VNNRIIKIKQIIEHYYFHQSNQATDIRFLALSLQLFSGKLYIKQGLDRTIEALKKYPYTSHEDEKMKFYRPAVRSLEGMVIGEDTKNQVFLNDFWKELGMMSTCNLKHIKYEDDEDKPTEFIKDTREALEYIIIDNKEKLLSDDSKFEVIIGSIIYIFKIFKEVIENNLNNKILGRHAIRTLIEVYIMVKYLLKKEKDKPNIWQEYKYYGISKYKLILLKAREDMSSKAQENHHLATSLLDAIVNEKKWEEFVDIDLRYFDQESIRNKSTYVEEKELYDLFYNYDTNYVHGFWGAIRESSMLFCDNSAHKYHNVPDFISEQNLPSVKGSCIMIVKKIIKLSCDLYEYPEWYINEYINRDDSNEKKDD